MGVVYRHCIATAMLCHTTSQLFTAESTLDLLSPWRVWRGYINRMLRSTNERDSSSGRDDIGWASGSFLRRRRVQDPVLVAAADHRRRLDRAFHRDPALRLHHRRGGGRAVRGVLPGRRGQSDHDRGGVLIHRLAHRARAAGGTAGGGRCGVLGEPRRHLRHAGRHHQLLLHLPRLLRHRHGLRRQRRVRVVGAVDLRTHRAGFGVLGRRIMERLRGGLGGVGGRRGAWCTASAKSPWASRSTKDAAASPPWKG